MSLTVAASHGDAAHPDAGRRVSTVLLALDEHLFNPDASQWLVIDSGNTAVPPTVGPSPADGGALEIETLCAAGTRVAASLGAEPDTFVGLAGVGDLLAVMAGDERPEERLGRALERDLLMFQHRPARCPRLQLACLNRIPLARGLGSSAATRALGVMLGQMLADQGVNLEELCDQAARDEGSADNVAACTHGGLVSALAEGPRVRVLRCSVHPCWKVVVAIPPFPLETERSRQVLPAHGACKDVCCNAVPLPWFFQGVPRGKGGLLALGSQDRLHQSYRQGLIPGMGSVFQGAVRAGASACYLSGAGSTLAAWVDTRHVDPAAVASAMELAWSPFTSCRARVLSVLGSGASCQIVDA